VEQQAVHSAGGPERRRADRQEDDAQTLIWGAAFDQAAFDLSSRSKFPLRGRIENGVDVPFHLSFDLAWRCTKENRLRRERCPGYKRLLLTDGLKVVFAATGQLRGEIMDFKQFYFSAQGRVNRKQWWLKLVLPVFVISIILALVDMATGNFDPQNGVGLFSSIFALIVIIPAILVYIKRFHDRDKSGWWVLIVLIPIIGAIWILIELGFLAGTPGPNRFGPPPLD
jgi:uncharacterized membrane protein YhaH (DUF805 family)